MASRTTALGFKISILKGEFDLAMQGIYEPIAEAGTAALREAADEGKRKARAAIGAAGFSTRWQNALRADVFPKRGVSARAAVKFYHAIPYAGVFEEGATIRGKPKLYLPLPSTPKRAARQRLTPEKFVKNLGPLFGMKIKGRSYLGARIGLSKPAAKRGAPYKVTTTALRKGKAFQGVVRTVPVFIGVDTVTLRKRFDLQSVFDDTAATLPSLYTKNLKV